ncbi:hypothetical protein BC829DRAFT_18382 [Chytridium lagenaria]|nr:hypothetical protein BC829DRAFT_18382 [Chytridium lagenaria]
MLFALSVVEVADFVRVNGGQASSFWRGRKTCMLSHIRIGSLPLTFTVWKSPGNFGDATAINPVADIKRNPLEENHKKELKQKFLHFLIEECRQAFRDFIHIVLAIPEVMEKSKDPPYTYEEVAYLASSEFKKIADSITFLTTQTNVQAYVVSVFIPKLKRGASTIDDSETYPAPSPASRVVHTSDNSMVAFAVAQLLPVSKHIWLHHLVLRSPSLQQGSLDGDLLCKLIKAVDDDELMPQRIQLRRGRGLSSLEFRDCLQS